ncbi:MAG TPA: hypothetical protein PJ982_06700, partial [Lacipirellulaceae bacterium]|nr:hypothetical protein [Lacipirellulaceae bacterium]
PPRGANEGEEPPPHDPLIVALEARLAELADQVDEQIQEQFINEQGGLFPAIMGNSRVRAQMMQTLSRLARRSVEQLSARPEVANRALCDASTAPSASAASFPRFLQHGGAYRRLAATPDQLVGAKPIEFWREVFGPEYTVVAAPIHEVATVCEGWDAPLIDAAISLINCRRDYADFAARVQTRSDVPWMPLASPMAAFSSSFEPPAGAGPVATQVL